MGVVNTGMQRAVALTVDKTIGGVSVNGYPKVYKMAAFGVLPEKSETELAQMPVEEYMDRLAAFQEYVQGIETGITVDGDGAYTRNLTSCPIG